MQLRLLDYLPTTAPQDPQKQPKRWPDVLRALPLTGFELPPKENRCLWLTVRIPAETKAGVYSGSVTLTEAGGGKLLVPLQVTVHDLLLPNLSQGDFRVDFWQDFGALARQYGVAQWSEEWWALAKTFVEDLADHGQSVVQVGRSHFDWTLAPGGEWQFGFDRFDRHVKLCDSVGVSGLIEYLQMFDGRGDTWLYYTDSLGKAQKTKSNPGDPLFDEVWLAFGKALAVHCRENGWLQRLYVCPTDEPQDVYLQPTLHRFKHCCALLKEADAGHRTTAALDARQSVRDLAPHLDRFVFRLHEDAYDPKLAGDLRKQGKLVEAYVGGQPDRPNSFLTSEAIEQRALGWICWQEQFRGLLRWSYANWPKDVWSKPEGEGKSAPGDLFIVYPGDQRPLASARWERMREGFEDWQMLQAVQRKILKAPSSARKDATQKAYDEAIAAVAGPRGKLTAYTRDPQVLLEARRRLLLAADQL